MFPTPEGTAEELVEVGRGSSSFRLEELLLTLSV
jgi:hypothetical protein